MGGCNSKASTDTKQTASKTREITPTETAPAHPPLDPHPLSEYVSWAGHRNRDPILKVLKEKLPSSGKVLEIATGSGMHLTYFAPHFPNVQFQPSEKDDETFANIRKLRDEGKVSNIEDPVRIDLTEPQSFKVVGDKKYGAIFVINIFQVAPISIADGLFGAGAHLLTEDGSLLVYGPFKVSGSFTTSSNADFDA
eukprot:Hpha_TRINITY_DN16314_c0_g1::TRINITY_DN16314_c0_g1_i5::g.60770::m.60770